MLRAVGEFSVQLDCREARLPPAPGQMLILELRGRRLSAEVLRVARYPQPLRLEGGGLATHFVRLRPRSAYLEE